MCFKRRPKTIVAIRLSSWILENLPLHLSITLLQTSSADVLLNSLLVWRANNKQSKNLLLNHCSRCLNNFVCKQRKESLCAKWWWNTMNTFDCSRFDAALNKCWYCKCWSRVVEYQLHINLCSVWEFESPIFLSAMAPTLVYRWKSYTVLIIFQQYKHLCRIRIWNFLWFLLHLFANVCLANHHNLKIKVNFAIWNLLLQFESSLSLIFVILIDSCVLCIQFWKAKMFEMFSIFRI